MATATADDWFRSPVWDEQIEAAFERRLRRARPHNRAQYLRIQATHLLSSPDPPVREAGRGLLWRVITEFPDDTEAKTAMEQLGGSLADEGRLGEAEHALRETATPDAPRRPPACWRRSGRTSGRNGSSATWFSGTCSPRPGPPGSGTIRLCARLPAKPSRLPPKRLQRCRVTRASDVPRRPRLTSLNWSSLSVHVRPCPRDAWRSGRWAARLGGADRLWSRFGWYSGRKVDDVRGRW